MNDLITTGIHGLDEILLGGIKRGNILLVEGPAGAGKTTMGLEFIYRGVTEMKEPGLIITFEMAPEKLLRDAAGFGWDLRALDEAGRLKIVYTSPQVLLQELHSHDGLLLKEIRAIKAKRLLLDGLTPLKLFGELFNGRPFRDTLHLLVEMLQREGLTAMLTRETPEAEEGRARELSHEQFICDTVITLRSEFMSRQRVRSVTVSKSRGQDFVPGRHTMRIEANQGVRIYQRSQSRSRKVTDQPTSAERSSVGSPPLDQMMGGGVIDGSATLVVGVSGTGKTVMGMQFLSEGARQGKPGLMVTLDEHPAQILRNADGLGLNLQRHVREKKIHIYYESPQELELDVHFDRLIKMIDEHKIQRVVVDSLAAYATSEQRRSEFHDFIYALTTAFKDRLVTSVMSYESPELLGVSQISEEIKASTIVDNIVLLNYVEFSNRLRRALTVPKSRGSRPSRLTREYRISKGGICLEPAEHGAEDDSVPQLPFSAYYGILARSPARRSPVIEEQVFNGDKEKPDNASRTVPMEDGPTPAPKTGNQKRGATATARAPGKRKKP